MKLFIVLFSLTLSSAAWAEQPCHADISLWKSIKLDGFEEPLDSSVDFDIISTKPFLAERGYVLVGTKAYKYPNNVALSVSIDENLQYAKVTYLKWSLKDYGDLVPSDGDTLLLKETIKGLRAESFDAAVTEVLQQIRSCQEILKIYNP